MPRRILRWASYHVGNRGVAAFILGLIWSLIGLSMLLDPGAQRVLPDSILPLWVRALFWIGPGVYAMAWTIATPVVRTDDHNLWGLLMIGPVVRFVTFVAAGIIDVFNLAHEDFDGLSIGILLWLAVIALVWTCAVGLDRLPPVRPGRPDDGQ